MTDHEPARADSIHERLTQRGPLPAVQGAIPAASLPPGVIPSRAGVAPPPALRPANALALQRVIGNRRIADVVQSSRAASQRPPSRLGEPAATSAPATVRRTFFFQGREYDENTAPIATLQDILAAISNWGEARGRAKTIPIIKEALAKRVPVPVPAPAASAPQGAPKGATKFEVAYLTKENRAQVLKTVEGWHDYAEKKLGEYEKMKKEMEVKKDELTKKQRDKVIDEEFDLEDKVRDLKAKVEEAAAAGRQASEEQAPAEGTGEAKGAGAQERALAGIRQELVSVEAQLAKAQLEGKGRMEQAKGAYYAPENASFREDYKSINFRKEHLYGAENESKVIVKHIRATENDESKTKDFRLLTDGTRLQAVMEMVGTSFVANIASDPANLAPERPEDKPTGGIAKALIGRAILENQGAGWQKDITLMALTAKVRKIYDRYYFHVYQNRDERQLVQRPLQFGQKETVAGVPVEPQKTEWHRHKDMVLTQAKAKEFVGKENLEGVLTIPPELQGPLGQLKTQA